ncbi:SDR family NAD(P)-dependent oxidoreductase [Novosphingobium album (ex Liu et al. 2023)]|uniref:SDR family oxidoreductase n=1 Tax=Novosphingobium album (ex Liu et al. 2023) TaxID=3031130 RepID=A0ABT5WVX3_9SPHN|nr:SDR family oxidoreductase [Novosphingobium album (ex Liu et al. 2023)]MDE8653999.1 SDR family oxidoreductase [Novosphingobium album (ex Liu et al. 2023)]
MDGLVQGKVAVITGAGSGVGRAAVLLFCEHGARVIAADIDGANAEETAAMARAAGGEARAVACNVADPASVDATVAAAVEAFGRLDVIYNNAGITISPVPGKGLRSLVECDPEEMKRVEDVNINGVIYGCQAAIRQFAMQGSGGAIVSTASVAGLMGYGGVLYGATKGAVVQLTRALAIEVADQGIRVNAVCPAGMLTHYAGMNPDSEQRDAILQGMGRAHPLGKAIDPRDTAAAAMFLCSDLAANITGVNLPVDGGLVAGRKVGR